MVKRIHVPEGQLLQIYVRSESGIRMLMELTGVTVSIVFKSPEEKS
jgi:hypothetical protein